MNLRTLSNEGTENDSFIAEIGKIRPKKYQAPFSGPGMGKDMYVR